MQIFYRLIIRSPLIRRVQTGQKLVAGVSFFPLDNKVDPWISQILHCSDFLLLGGRNSEYKFCYVTTNSSLIFFVENVVATKELEDISTSSVVQL